MNLLWTNLLVAFKVYLKYYGQVSLMFFFFFFENRFWFSPNFKVHWFIEDHMSMCIGPRTCICVEKKCLGQYESEDRH